MLTLRTVVLTALLFGSSSAISLIASDPPVAGPTVGTSEFTAPTPPPLQPLAEAAWRTDPAHIPEVMLALTGAASADSVVIHCLYCVNRPSTGEFMYTTHPTLCQGGSVDGSAHPMTLEDGEGCTPCAVIHSGGGGGHLLGMEQWECDSGNWQPGSCPTMSCEDGGDPEEFAAISSALEAGQFERLRSLLDFTSLAHFDPLHGVIVMTDCASGQTHVVKLDDAAASALRGIDARRAAPLTRADV